MPLFSMKIISRKFSNKKCINIIDQSWKAHVVLQSESSFSTKKLSTIQQPCVSMVFRFCWAFYRYTVGVHRKALVGEKFIRMNRAKRAILFKRWTLTTCLRGKLDNWMIEQKVHDYEKYLIYKYFKFESKGKSRIFGWI